MRDAGCGMLKKVVSFTQELSSFILISLATPNEDDQ